MRSTLLALAVLGAAATRADAFCGFYVGGAGAQMFNNASEVVLMRHGTTTVLSMQNNYQGPPDHFALVVPVPVVVRQSQVKTLPHELFDKIDTLGAPRLVEYWEHDPCKRYVDYNSIPTPDMAEASEDDSPAPSKGEDYHVKIEAKFSVGEYDIVVLSAQESTGLDRWLHANHYTIPEGAEPLLRPYVEQGMKFFVAKVDPKKVTFKAGMATLSPLRFYYDSPEFSLPIRLGLANSSGTQDLIINILAPNLRYEVANHPNVTIPTNLPVRDDVRTRFGEFYAALFDHTIEAVPDAVVTEYSWDSGSCDPCPGPTLDPEDVATLGADVIGSTYKDTDGASYTLTRLHARYGKDIKDDLVFRAVEPIVGGRGIPDLSGAVSMDVTRDSTNNFQGRYIITHPWTGPIACAEPQRGQWGGPIDPSQQIATQAATNLAFAPRGNAQLGAMLAKDLPQIGIMSSIGAHPPIPPRQPQGCGCATNDPSTGSAAIFGFVVIAIRRRRQRR